MEEVGQGGSIQRDWAGLRWGEGHRGSEKRQQRGRWAELQSPVL